MNGVNASAGRDKTASAVLAGLADELVSRVQAGVPIDWEAVAREHPEHAAELRRLVQALGALEALSRSVREGGSSGLGVPAGPDATLEAGVLGDFRLIREVGRGGMGVVYEAEQVSLGRRVALKVLPFAATMDPRQLQRFHNEARAAAGLHHTNIVPVHGVGCERGVHYYAMQFIEGRTLADFIAQQQGTSPSQVPTMDAAEAGAAAASSPTVPRAAQATSAAPRDAAYFRRAVEWGIQAAEALDCAHTLGVVHRDVKPANLMMDTIGRLWVTDFGLAHVQSDARLTMTGDLVGTLRYMSPEQALARRMVMDHRTDVYSLGATLYELLTLRPAYAGHDRQELLRQIAFEEPMPPRSMNRSIPVELETIVLKAMEKNPADRYVTAKDLADDLRLFLEDKAIRARRPTLRQRAGKWARRHRAAVAATAMCLLVTLAALIGSAAWVLGDRAARQREAEGKVREALEAAEAGLQDGNPEDAALSASVQRAEDQLGGGMRAPELRRRVEQLRRNVDVLRRLEEARLQAAASSKEMIFDYAGADRLYANAFEGYGLDVTALGPQEAAERVRASAIRTRLIAGLDDWASVRDLLIKGSGAPVRSVADQADDDPWRRRLRGATGRGDRAALEGLAAEEESWSQPPANLVLLAVALRDAGSSTATKLLRQAQAGHPADFWINFQLAGGLWKKKSPDTAEAIRFLQAALALRPLSPVVYNNIGIVLRDQGKLAEAEMACRKAIELKPNFAEAHKSLGNALREQGKTAEAEAACRKAIVLKPDYAEAHNNLGNVLHDQGKLAEAVAAYQKAIELKPDYAEALSNLGTSLLAQGKPAEAEAACRKAIELKPDYAEAHGNLGRALHHQGKLGEAVAANKKAIELKPDLAEAHGNLGIVLRAQRKPAEAEAAFRKAIELKPDLAEALLNLGTALHDQGKLAEAVAVYQKAIEHKPDYAEAHSNLGTSLLAQGKPAEAEAAFRKAIELKPDYAEAHNNLGSALHDQGKLAEAVAANKKAIELKPDLAEAYGNLGTSLLAQRKLAEAEAAFQKAIELKPDNAAAHGALGNALHDQGKLAEAVAAYKKVIELKPDLAEAHYSLGNVMDHLGKLAEAVAAYKKAIALKPDFAEAHCNLGKALQQQGHFADALAARKPGHELGSRQPNWRYPSAQWVREAERLVVLDAKLPRVLKGEVEPADVGERLALAQICQLPCKSLHAAAVRFYADAFAEHPTLADDLQHQHRYYAACAAALAGCGRGKDGGGLPDKDFVRFRNQALKWLRDDLTAWHKVQDKYGDKARPAFEQQMAHWLEDTDFAGVRGSEALARLPETERKDWQRLWEEVEALRKEAAQPPKPPAAGRP